MEAERIDFLHDNLAHSGLEAETCQEVRLARPVGSILRTLEGWPVLSVESHGVRHLLDGPMHYQMIERLGREPDAVVILFGIGAGNAVRTLRMNGVPVPVVFEPDPGILRTFLQQGPTDLADVTIVTNERELETIWSRVIGDRDNVHVADTPGYDKLFFERRQSLNTRIADLLERNLVNEQTLRARGRVWVEDILENAEHMAVAPCAHHLQGAFAGVPAFVVGAGPSLNKNLEQLRQAGKKGIVFAVNSSGRALDRAHIEPHILACLESIDVSPLISDLSFIDNVVRVFSLTANPELFKTGKGPLLTVFELLPHIAGPFEAFYGRPGLPVCGSVSTACFSLAYRMGCDPIVLLGQDLAYTDGEVYAKGTPYEASRVQFAEDKKSVQHEWCGTMTETHERAKNPLLDGQKLTESVRWGGDGVVYSSATFNHVRMWFERIGSLLNQSGGPRLINATEGGARILNFEEARLSDLLADMPDRDITVSNIMEQARLGGPEMGVGDVINLLRNNQRGAEAVATAARVLSQASRAAEQEWDNPDPSLLSRRLRELQYAEAELRAVVNRWPWVDAWAWGDVEDALLPLEEESHLPVALRGIRSEGRLGDAICSSARALAERLELKHLDLKLRYEKKN